jgi:hypothetical protein
MTLSGNRETKAFAAKREKGPAPAASGIVHSEREVQLEWVFEILFGLGSLAKDTAIRTAADALKTLGLVEYDDLERGSETYAAIERAIDAGIKQGRFDRPKRGDVRAIRPDPREYTPDDWHLCLTSALDREPTARDAALRFAAYWAASTMGLQFARLHPAGVILTGLDAALRAALEKGEIVDAGSGCVRKA